MKKILVIDDDKIIAESIRDIFELEDFEIDSAVNGIDGIVKATNTLYDFIICDIDMPELNGYQVINQIKNDERYFSVPFIFLSGKNKQTDIIKGLKLGADDYITKPFTVKDITEVVFAKLKRKEKLDALIEQKLNHIKSGISFSLPHEFLTPINGIIGPISMLIDNKIEFEEEEINEMHNVIFNSAQRLKKTVENFLIYNELNLNNIDLKYEVIDIYEVIIKIVNHLSKNYDRVDNITIDLEFSILNTNKKFFSILMNEILSNAFKFSGFGEKILVKAYSLNDKNYIEVTDFGRGMSQEQINSIDSFVQFDRKYYEQQGIGLGIAIIKSISKLFKYKLEFISELNKFTTVKLTLN